MIIYEKDKSRYPYIYRARVVNNVDADNIGKIQVVIPTLSGEDCVIWARPISAFGYKSNFGSHVVPTVGSYVYVTFEDGDIRFPVYLGGVVLKGQVLADSTTDGPQQKEYVILRTENGSLMKISDNKDKITLRTPSGRIIEIDDSTSRIILKTENHRIEMNDEDSKITIEADNNIHIKANTQITLQAPRIRLIGGSPAICELEGSFTMIGDLEVIGNIHATGTIIDNSGNTNHHSHG